MYIYIYIGAVEVVHSDFGAGVSFVIITYCFVYRWWNVYIRGRFFSCLYADFDTRFIKSLVVAVCWLLVVTLNLFQEVSLCVLKDLNYRAPVFTLICLKGIVSQAKLFLVLYFHFVSAAVEGFFDCCLTLSCCIFSFDFVVTCPSVNYLKSAVSVY